MLAVTWLDYFYTLKKAYILVTVHMIAYCCTTGFVKEKANNTGDEGQNAADEMAEETDRSAGLPLGFYCILRLWTSRRNSLRST